MNPAREGAVFNAAPGDSRDDGLVHKGVGLGSCAQTLPTPLYSLASGLSMPCAYIKLPESLGPKAGYLKLGDFLYGAKHLLLAEGESQKLLKRLRRLRIKSQDLADSGRLHATLPRPGRLPCREATGERVLQGVNDFGVRPSSDALDVVPDVEGGQFCHIDK